MIAEECKRAGLKPPHWDIREQTVQLVFFTNSSAGDDKSDMGESAKVKGAVKGAHKGAVGGADLDRDKGATRAVKAKLSILLHSIAKNEGNRVPDYQNTVGFSDSTMERYIKLLRESGLIEFRGEAAQIGGYYLTRKMKAKLK